MMAHCHRAPTSTSTSTTDGVRPYSVRVRPYSDGVRPYSDGVRPYSDGVRPCYWWHAPLSRAQLSLAAFIINQTCCDGFEQLSSAW